MKKLLSFGLGSFGGYEATDGIFNTASILTDVHTVSADIVAHATQPVTPDTGNLVLELVKIVGGIAIPLLLRWIEKKFAKKTA